MKVYGIFFGGSNYSHQFLTNDDVEEFKSVKTAKEVFWSRIDFDPYFPCVDNTAEMCLFYTNPRSERSSDFLDLGYPDRILKIGPRGGIVEEKL